MNRLQREISSGTLWFAVLGLLACHRPSRPSGPALAAPPRESIALRVPLKALQARQLIRTTLFENGYQVHAENREGGWIRTDLGGLWEDQHRFRQWHIVAEYSYDAATTSTTVSLRAIEESTSFLVSIAAGHGALANTTGFTRVAVVTDVTSGDARSIWLQMERLAVAFSDRGAELLTDLSARR